MVVKRMTTPNIFRRVLIYFLISWTVILGISFFASYFYIRSSSPTQPNIATRQIYPQRMKQQIKHNPGEPKPYHLWVHNDDMQLALDTLFIESK